MRFYFMVCKARNELAGWQALRDTPSCLNHKLITGPAYWLVQPESFCESAYLYILETSFYRLNSRECHTEK